MNIKTNTLPNGHTQVIITDRRKGITREYLLRTDAEVLELIQSEQAQHIALREKESQERDATVYRNLLTKSCR